MPTEKLTEAKARSAKPKQKLFKLGDGRGLFLWVFPTGAKRWRLTYRHEGKAKEFALGVYPEVGIAKARTDAAEARKLVREGVDPVSKRQGKLDTQTATFNEIAEEFIAKKRREGKAEATLTKVEWLLQQARSDLGPRPIAEILAPEILSVLQVVERRGRLESARRLRAVIGEVFRYGVATGRCQGDPTGALRGAIASPVVKHRAAIVDANGFGGVLRSVFDYAGAIETAAALKLSALLFVRPGELRLAEWREFDFDRRIWEIPAGRMKMRRAHRVPLSNQVIAILADLKQSTGDGRLLFPGGRSTERPISENTLNAALRRLGYSKEQMTSHGFRAAAASLLNESGLFNADSIEVQLAHQEGNAVRRAYARSEFWEERIRMMQWWADACDRLRASGILVPDVAKEVLIVGNVR